MPRPKSIINPIWGNRLKELCKREHITQAALAQSIPISQQTISKIINSSASLTEQTARRISAKYPSYSFEWLMGYVDHKNELEHFVQAINQCQREGDTLMRGLLAFASLSGFEIRLASPAHGPGEDSAPVEKWLKMIKDGYMITRGDQKVCLSPEKMNRIQNEICDFVEFKLNKLFEERNSNG